MSLQIRELSEELQQRANKELNEDRNRLADDVRILREWLAKEPHLKVRDSDQFLVNFLRGSKHSLERFKEKMDLYYTLRNVLPMVFSNWDPLHPVNRTIIRSGFFLPLPRTVTTDGPRVILMRIGVLDPNTMQGTIEDMFRVQLMYFAICTRDDDNMIVAGQTTIMDMAQVSMAHLMQMTPGLMKKMSLLAQDSNPLRQKGMHHINMNPAIEGFLNLCRKFLNEKITNRMYFYNSDLTKLYEHIPKWVLPLEYGGEAGPIQGIIDDWERTLIENRDYLMDETNHRTDESKRTKPLKKHAETLFGTDGSFRKLDVD